MAKRALILVWLMLTATFFSNSQSLESVRKTLLFKDYEKGLKLIDSELEAFKKRGAYERKAFPYLLLKGQTEVKFGQLAQAEETLLEAKRLFDLREELGKKHKAFEYDVLDELAMLYLKTGHKLAVEPLVEQNLLYRAERFSRKDPIRYRTNLPYALYLKSIGGFDKAKEYLLQYQKYIRNSNHTSKAEIDRYADTYRLLYLMEAQEVGSIHALHLAKKNYHYQKHLWTRIDAGRNTHKKTEALSFIAQELIKLERYDQAQEMINKAFEVYRKDFDEDGFILTGVYVSQAAVYEEMDDFESARYALEKVMSLHLENIDENFSKLSTAEKEFTYERIKKDLDQVYAFLVRRLQEGHEIPEGFILKILDTRLRTKAIILNETNKLYAAILNSSDDVLKGKFDEWKLLKNQYAFHVAHFGVDTEARRLEQSLISIEKELAKSSDLFKNQEKGVTLDVLKSKMKPGDCLIEMIRLEVTSKPHYIILAIHEHSEPEVYLLGDGEELESKYLKLYTNSIKYQIEDNNSYGYYVEPLLGGENNVKRLIVSPDGVYNQINLSIVKNGAGYVLDELEVVNLTNLAQFADAKVQADLERALLIGRPKYFKEHSTLTGDGTRALRGLTRDGVSDLPGTLLEVNSISELLADHEIEIKKLLGEAATEESIKNASSFDVLHIATHGFFHMSDTLADPMLSSGLLLAGLDQSHLGEDNVLTAFEASNLNLQNTELVVLSACETGLGEVKEGEGVYGLQRAFEVAGVKYLIMSMWKVSDEATKELMTAFYKNQMEGMSIPEAFQKAQQSLRDSYPDVKYWGAFKLVGI